MSITLTIDPEIRAHDRDIYIASLLSRIGLVDEVRVDLTGIGLAVAERLTKDGIKVVGFRPTDV